MNTTDRPLRWGIIATGNLASQVAADLVALPDDAVLAAVASRSQASADAFAARFGCPTALASYTALADADIDVAWVTSPHTDHFRTTAALLEAGIPVLCEKPLTTNPDDTRALIDIARANDTFLMEAVWMRCHPIIRHVAALVSAGTIGDVVHVRASFAIGFDVPDTHRLRDPGLGGGAILDLGVYPVHFIETILGRPSSIFARGTLTSTGVDAASTAILDYPATPDRPAAQGVAFASIEATSEHSAEIVGTKGRIVIEGFFLNPQRATLIRPGHADEKIVTATIGNGYIHEIREVVACIRMGLSSSPLVSWDSTVNAADIVHAWRSALEDPTGHAVI